MNKRIRKKLSRRVCPRCRRTGGCWQWRVLRTGRAVRDFRFCTRCDLGRDEAPTEALVVQERKRDREQFLRDDEEE